jgi:hypothetical protein
MRSIGRWTAIPLAAVALALGGGAPAGAAGGDGTPSAAATAARQARLDTARARWKAFGADSYTYTTQGACSMCANAPKVTVRVVDGRSTVTPAGHRDVATVGRLFSLIQDLIDDEPSSLRVTYGPRSGVPQTITSQVSRGGLDDVSGLFVRGFRRLAD